MLEVTGLRPAAAYGAAVATTHPRVHVLAIVCATAVVLVTGCSSSSSHPGHATSSAIAPRTVVPLYPTFGPSGTLGTSNDPRFASTLRAVDAELAAVPMPPGATRSQVAPVRALTANTNYPECGDLIDRLAYWVLTGSLSDAVAYTKAHPPKHLPYVVSGTDTSKNRVLRLLDFGDISPSGKGMQVQIAFTPVGQGVGARIDARAVWPGPDGCKTS
jgi:hypothetical protein